jgi:hypothetical protein
MLAVVAVYRDTPVCDICSGSGVVARLVADSFPMPDPLDPFASDSVQGSIGDWALCRACAPLVAVGDWAAVTERALLSMPGGADSDGWARPWFVALYARLAAHSSGVVLPEGGA